MLHRESMNFPLLLNFESGSCDVCETWHEIWQYVPYKACGPCLWWLNLLAWLSRCRALRLICGLVRQVSQASLTDWILPELRRMLLDMMAKPVMWSLLSVSVEETQKEKKMEKVLLNALFCSEFNCLVGIYQCCVFFCFNPSPFLTPEKHLSRLSS